MATADDKIAALEGRIAALEARLDEKEIPPLPWPSDLIGTVPGAPIVEELWKYDGWAPPGSPHPWPEGAPGSSQRAHAQFRAYRHNESLPRCLAIGSLQAQWEELERIQRVRYWAERPAEAARAIVARCRALAKEQALEDQRERALLRQEIMEVADAALTDSKAVARLKCRHQAPPALTKLHPERSDNGVGFFIEAHPRKYGQDSSARHVLEELTRSQAPPAGAEPKN